MIYLDGRGRGKRWNVVVGSRYRGGVAHRPSLEVQLSGIGHNDHASAYSPWVIVVCDGKWEWKILGGSRRGKRVCQMSPSCN